MMTVGQSPSRNKRGLVIGELLVAVLLLTVAVSSLAALMYSVSHREQIPAKLECVSGAKSVDARCVSDRVAPKAAKIVKSTTNTVCAGESAVLTRECKEAQSSRAGAVIKARTDSESVALIGKKEKESRKQVRTDLGFIR